MTEKGRSTPRRRTGFDVRMLVAALLAAAVVVGVSLAYKISERREQVHDSALDLARQLVAMPSGQQAREELNSHIQRVLDYQTRNGAFAYAGVYTNSGEVLARTLAPGVVAPTALPVLSASWVQNATPEVQDNRELLAFVGPAQTAGDGGFYRVGYFQPGVEIASEEFGFLAAVTLPVFLLALCGLALMRRAVDPLRGLNQKLSLEFGEQQAGSQSAGKAGRGDMEAFVTQFNTFMEQAQRRIDDYQNERDTMATSERFLHYRLNRFEALLHALPDGVVVLDDSRRVTFANDRALRLLEQDLTELTGKALSSVLQGRSEGTRENDPLQALQEWCGRFEGTKALMNMPEPLSFRPADTGNLVLTCSAHPVAGLDGAEPTGYLLTFSDTTREALAQEKRAEFVAHVSHELKSPLNTLGMCVETLKAPVDTSAVNQETDAEFRLEAVNIIGDEVERLAALISNLLNITQIEMGNMEPHRTRVRLADLIEDVFTSTTRSATDSTLKFELDLPTKVPAVLIDKDLMRIALNNLVTNAIKYSNPGGSIRVSVAESDEAISISVQDSGIGIPVAEQASIFNKFYRSEDQVARARGGQGLGLSLAQEIVQMQHGAIRVESAPGEGSTFTIDLWKSAEIVQQAI